MKHIFFTAIFIIFTYKLNAQAFNSNGEIIETKDVGNIYIADTMGVFQWSDEKQKLIQVDIRFTPIRLQINHKGWLILLGDKMFKILNRNVEQDGDNYFCLDKDDNKINIFISSKLEKIIVSFRGPSDQYVKIMMYFTGIQQIL